ncbi:MAG: YceD family protein [Granulosicoccus sp.]
MVKVLPDRFNPDLLARDGTLFEKVLPQASLKRLSHILTSNHHDVKITARFSRRKDHIAVAGKLSTVFALQCQRCLGPIEVHIDEPYELVFVENEQSAELLPKQLDPVVLDEHGQIQVVDLFEDELILHVPDIPKHPDMADCRVARTEFGELPDDVDENRPNPFGALKDLQLH